MEIKTDLQIHNDYMNYVRGIDAHSSKEYNDKLSEFKENKWVKVDDMIKEIELMRQAFNDRCLENKHIDMLIKELCKNEIK